MFRKYYKEANDDLQPRRELIDEIFEKASKRESRKIYKLAMRYGGAVAAVLVISATAIFYPQIQKMNENYLVTVSEVEKDATLGGDEEKLSTLVEKMMPAKENHAQDKKEPKSDSIAEEKVINGTAEYEIEKEARAITEDFAIISGRVSLESISDVIETEKEVVSSFLYSVFGEIDRETQNQHIFEIAGKFEDGGETFYIGRWRWWVVDHSSLLTEFVLDEKLSQMYECRIEEGEIIWTTENNFLEK
ncbi:MAG: hypothetical protein J6D15_01800 [Clostridia bacterium]|nr:hypothetical protein [Clostridia bacterium]